MTSTDPASGGALNKLKGLILPTGAQQPPKPIATQGLKRQDSFPEICSTPSDVGIFEVAHNKCRGPDGKFSWRKFFFEAPSRPDTPRGPAAGPMSGTAASAAAGAAAGSSSSSQ